MTNAAHRQAIITNLQSQGFNLELAHENVIEYAHDIIKQYKDSLTTWAQGTQLQTNILMQLGSKPVNILAFSNTELATMLPELEPRHVARYYQPNIAYYYQYARKGITEAPTLAIKEQFQAFCDSRNGALNQNFTVVNDGPNVKVTLSSGNYLSQVNFTQMVESVIVNSILANNPDGALSVFYVRYASVIAQSILNEQADFYSGLLLSPVSTVLTASPDTLLPVLWNLSYSG